ncbi:hypothetical protein H0H93_012019 [Arthromyces matolae]|nr:hypothetical protein H0H93_012019 [Arthromyces matolae]
MLKGTKRASPGAEDEKNALTEVELSDEDAEKLRISQREVARVELALERDAQKRLAPAYDKRRETIRTIAKFWPVALLNHSIISYHAQHDADKLALSYLEDVWVKRDPAEPRCYTIEFTFKENPYFTDKVLKKEFKFVPPPAAANETPDADGITESMLEFSWERDVVISGQKINWKEADKNLTKLYPRETSEDEDENQIGDPGSFFNFFEHDTDTNEMGITIANEIFPDAIEYFLGHAGGEDIDSDDEEDDDEDDAEEIDLEKPRTKKQKNDKSVPSSNATIMKFLSPSRLVSVASLPLLAAAHGGNAYAGRNALHPRQAAVEAAASGSSSVTSPATTSTTSPAAAPVTSTTSVPAANTVVTTPANTVVTTPANTVVTTPANTVVTTPVATTPTTTYSFSLASTNPTAVPLTEIVSNAASSVTSPLATTFAAGSTPTGVPGAPVLPDITLLNPANYPALDKIPFTNTSIVQEWINEVYNSGISIPDYSPTNPGGCPNNTAAVADTERCWWTCGGCTRSTDVTECPTSMTWGLTYDDGPAYYTSDLLDYLDQNNLKSTFFVVGSRVISFPAILQNEYMTGHQIAVHTWSHPSLTTLSNEEIIAELGWSKKVIKDVLGVTPNMMRPPYGDIDDRVRAISVAMGLTPVIWTRISPTATFDTDDFDIHGGLTTVDHVLQNWENIIGNATTMDSGFIVLEHDLFQQTVQVATGYILPDALAHQPPFTIQPVISCLNKPMSDAYIETNDNSTNPPAASGAVTLSSGAPGSAQATGSTTKGNTGSSLHFGSELLAGSLTAAAGLAAGLAILF